MGWMFFGGVIKISKIEKNRFFPVILMPAKKVVLTVSDHAIIASVSCGMLPRERMLSLISFFLFCLFFLLERVCSLSLMHDYYPFFFFVFWLFFSLGE
jgi:hypothetical protein